jgi:hypothetical protein
MWQITVEWFSSKTLMAIGKLAGFYFNIHEIKIYVVNTFSVHLLHSPQEASGNVQVYSRYLG